MELGLLAFGFFLSIWLFNVVLVPVLYGVPKSLVWAVRGWVRWRVPALYLIAPVVWLLVFFGGAVVVAVFFPGGMLRLRESGGFGMGQALGLLFSVGRSLFAASTRRDMRDDFLEFVRPHMTPKAPIVGGPQQGPPTVEDLYKLAVEYIAQGQYAQAEPLFKRSLEIEEEAHGANDPKVAMVLCNLAALYRAQGQYAQAEPLFKRSLELLEKAQHPAVTMTLEDMAALYRETNRVEEAEALEERAAVIWASRK